MRLPASALRFGLVGIAATLIHLAAAVALIEGGQVHPGIANGIAFVAANLVSYALNTRWSFSARMGLDTWSRYIGVSIAAWLLTVAIAWGVDVAGGHYLVGIGLIVMLVPVLTYTAHRNITYRSPAGTKANGP